MILSSPEQFHWSNKFWSVQSKYTIYPANLPKFVRVSQVLAVPSYEEVASMV